MNTLTDRTRTLSLTKEVEENGKIPFLDCLVTRSNNRLRTTFSENRRIQTDY